MHGKVLSKLAYLKFRPFFPSVSWGSWIWEVFISVRRSLILWRIIQECIPSWEVLHLQGFQGPSICHLCCTQEEIIDHICISCSFTRSLWAWIESAFQTYLDFNAGFDQFLIHAMKINFSRQVASFWKVAIITCVWNIWHSRNSCVFENMVPSMHKAKSFIWSAMKESNSISLGPINNIVKDLLCLHVLGISSNPCKVPSITAVHWYSPSIIGSK